jgi:chemotaxis response regulator CheB
MHARPATTNGTRHVARAAVRGAVGFTFGWLAFLAVAGLVVIGVAVAGIVAVAAILSHLPADTLPPPGR